MAVSIFLLSGLASVTGSHLGLSSTGSGLPSSSITAAVGANDADELILAEGSLARGVGPAAGQLWNCAQPSTGGSAHCTASLVSTAAKVPTWSSLTSPGARYGAGLVYDAKDGFVVLFGGGTGTTVLGDTWEFTHGSWIQLFPSTSPSARAYASMAYDAKDKYVILFGGETISPYTVLGDTWEFVGGKWTELSPTTSPPARYQAAMDYDAKDGYVVLFSGYSSPGSDTWKFVAGQWTKLAPPAAPGGRYKASMVYDAKDKYLLLFGGSNLTISATYGDTWKFVGGVWTQLTPTSSPSARFGMVMAYDAKDGYVVLFGGYYTGIIAGTWKWVAGAWTELTPTLAPPAQFSGTLAFDNNSMDHYAILFGGCTSAFCSPPVQTTWEFVAGKWTNHTPPLTTSPSARYSAAISYDGKDGYVLLFGGDGPSGSLGDTWKFAAGSWTQLSPATTPAVRYGAAMSYDAKDGYVLLFGGEGSTGNLLADTWKFVGGSWTELSPATSPSPRHSSGMTYDTKDGYVLLFGGYGASGELGDTWKFVGGAWTQLSPAKSPLPRFNSAMTYDTKNGYVVLFGGCGVTTCPFADTWKFVGGSWTQLSPTKSPSARQSFAMTYDAKEGYVLLFGGLGSGDQVLGDTWKFVGGAWTQLSPATSPPLRWIASMTYDTPEGYVLLFGGAGASVALNDTWTFP